jgi:hypothetical protein
MNEQQTNQEKSISERIDEIVARLSKDQLRFVVALQEYPNKKDAAEAIGLKPDTVYRWNGQVEEAARLIALERLEAAKAIRRNALIKAVMVKIAGLDSEDDALRQKTATEIIDWEMGKAGQSVDVTSGGEKLNLIRVSWDADNHTD